MLSLIEIYSAMWTVGHVVIRRPADWPRYKVGSDVDILTLVPDKMVKMLDTCKTAKYLEPYTVKVSKGSSGNIHYDYMNSTGIELRIDIYSELPYSWNKSTRQIIENKEKYNIYTDDFYWKSWSPCKEDETVMRLLEYQKYPNKKHHLKWIKANL